MCTSVACEASTNAYTHTCIWRMQTLKLFKLSRFASGSSVVTTGGARSRAGYVPGDHSVYIADLRASSLHVYAVPFVEPVSFCCHRSL